MATVFLADDLKHARRVAIKVLHPELAAVLGPDRFLKEIEIAAGLTHPHILPLHDSGEADGLLYYVMPYVEGESLRDRLDRETQLSIEDTTLIAAEVADALSYAHAREVVHRDIKPANIMLTGGHALVADFGIARAVSEAGGAKLTETGLSLGTPHYMSPEQASGATDIDGRSDVYALGCVTYEMLVGEPPYSGPNAQAIIAKVLTQPVPSVREGRETVTPAMDAVVHKALARLPADRFKTAKQYGAALQQSTDSMISGVSFPAAPADAQKAADRTWKIAAAAMAVVALGAVLLWAPWKGDDSSGPTEVYRLSVPTGPLAATGHVASPAVAISPDGSQIAYVAGTGSRGQIVVRHLGSGAVTPVLGAENAFGPFFSPDGEWLAYVEDGMLTKTRLSDGTVVVLTGAQEMHSASWTDDTILMGSTTESGYGISRISENGGAPETVLLPADSLGFFLLYPSLLPGGDGVVFTSVNGSGLPLGIWHLSLGTGELRRLVERAGMARYLPTGHLLYAESGGLYAVPFDANEGAVTGAPVRVVPDALVEQLGEPSIAHFAVSGNGTLVYLAKEEAVDLAQRFLWVDRAGQEEPIAFLSEPETAARIGSIWGPRLSPNGNRMLFWTAESAAQEANAGYNGALWIADLPRGTLSPMPRDSMENFWSVWTPDGQSVVSAGGGMSEDLSVALYSRRLDRVGPAVQRTHLGPSQWHQPYSFAADGSLLLLQQSEMGSGFDIWVLPWEGGGDPWPFLATPAEEYHPAISPDGSWLAYVSDESGQPEVYLTDFPEGATRRLVSVGGGSSPTWTSDGRELVYRKPVEGLVAMISVAVEVSEDGIELGRPEELFRGPYVEMWIPFGRFYDMTADGQRFFMARDAEPGQSFERVTVVLNWLDELESRFEE
jgi:serine/threonine-protein kinase